MLPIRLIDFTANINNTNWWP